MAENPECLENTGYAKAAHSADEPRGAGRQCASIRLLKSADLLRVIDTEPASADISGWFSGYADTGTNARAAISVSFRVDTRFCDNVPISITFEADSVRY